MTPAGGDLVVRVGRRADLGAVDAIERACFADPWPANSLLTELEAAAKRGDVEAMIRPVHSLKSSSANVGAVHLSALARDVEQHSRARDFGAAQLALADLYAAFADAEQALRAHVASASAA